MKAVITEIRGAKAAVLQDDGSIRLLENKNYKIGQVVEVKTTKWYSKATKWVAAAAAVLMITSGAASYAYLNPVATVSLDVNPGLEYKVNTFNRVIGVKAMNDDAVELIEDLDLDLKGMDLEEAIHTAIEAMIDKGYINKDDAEATVYISVNHKNEEKTREIVVKLGEDLTTFVEEKGLEGDVEVEGIGAERVELAAAVNKKLGDDYNITPGKLNLLQKLYESQGNSNALDTLDAVEDFLDEEIGGIAVEDLTVKDIMKEIKRNRLDVEILPEDQAKDKGNKTADGEDAVENDKGKPESAPGLEGKDKEDKSPNENANENANGGNAGGKNGGN